MILLANILIGIGTVLSMLLSFFIFIIIARAVLSWVNPDPYNPIVRFITAASDPVIRPIRRYVPHLGGLDLSPLVALAALILLQTAVAQSLQEYGESMKQRARLEMLKSEYEKNR